ncbi:cyc07 [Hordeum vulgare]|nr:cyc07 [Hordeum vulgare]
MERKAMVVCALVCFLGVLFAALVFAGEGTRVKGVPRPHPRCFRLGFLWFWSVDPFTKKQWYDIKTPLLFTSRNVGKTLMSRTQGTKFACPHIRDCDLSSTIAMKRIHPFSEGFLVIY